LTYAVGASSVTAAVRRRSSAALVAVTSKSSTQILSRGRVGIAGKRRQLDARLAWPGVGRGAQRRLGGYRGIRFVELGF